MSGRLPREAALVLTVHQCGLITFSRRAILERWQRAGFVPAGLLDLLDTCEEIARDARKGSANGSDPGSVPVPSFGAVVEAVRASEYVSTRKAAERLGVSTRRVRELLAEGRLLGRQRDERSAWQVDVGSVDAYAREQAERKAGAA